MNNPEKVVHAKKYPQTSFYRSLFAFYEQLLKVRVKKKSLFLSGTREKTGKKCHLLVERESPIFGVPAHSSLFIFWVPRWARLFTVLQLPLTYSQNEQVKAFRSSSISRRREWTQGASNEMQFICNALWYSISEQILFICMFDMIDRFLLRTSSRLLCCVKVGNGLFLSFIFCYNSG